MNECDIRWLKLFFNKPTKKILIRVQLASYYKKVVGFEMVEDDEMVNLEGRERRNLKYVENDEVLICEDF